MTARALALLLGARRTGRGKWTSKCPGHPDRTPSLSIAEGRKGIVLKCMSAGCDTKAILDVLGLSWADLFLGAPDKELKGRLADERKLERLDRRLDLVRWLLSLNPERRNYWLTAAARIVEEMGPLYWEVMPDQDKFEKVRRFEVEDYRNRRLDWLRERESKHAIGTQRESAQGLPPGHRPDGAGDGPPLCPQEVRPIGLHRPSPPVQDGGV